MFRNVLVLMDGSPMSEAALPWALAATEPHGFVHIVHVHEVLAPVAVEGMIFTTPSEDDSRREQEGVYLQQLTERLRAVTQSSINAWNIDPNGPFIETLREAATTTSSELVVMATHGRGPFARFWLGSVTDEFVRHSPVPVLVVRPSGHDAGSDFSARPKLDHLFIPLDGSPLAEQILDPAIRFGQLFGADFTLVFVTDSDDKLDEAESYLGGVAKSIFDRKGLAWTRVVRNGTPAQVVLELAGEDPSLGIALATHGRSGLGRLLRGSVADEMIRKAHGPVLVFHPSDGER